MDPDARPPVLACVLGTAFIGTGILHFVHPQLFVRIVPDVLPAHEALVEISGACEAAGGLGMFFPRTRRAASYGLIALLVAVFPANVNMAVNARRFADIAPASVLWSRLPFQALFIWLVSRAGRAKR